MPDNKNKYYNYENKSPEEIRAMTEQAQQIYKNLEMLLEQSNGFLNVLKNKNKI